MFSDFPFCTIFLEKLGLFSLKRMFLKVWKDDDKGFGGFAMLFRAGLRKDSCMQAASKK